MKLTVYNSEVFERGAMWYIIFSIFFTFFIVILLVSNNYVGVITLCFFLGGYMAFSVTILDPITIETANQFLRIGKKTYARSTIQGFVLEIHKHTERIKNIVFIIEGKDYIYTIKDTPQNTKDFLMVLNEELQLFNSYPQTTLQLFLRKLKL